MICFRDGTNNHLLALHTHTITQNNTHKHKWNEENFIHRGADFQNIRRKKEGRRGKRKKDDVEGGGGRG